MPMVRASVLFIFYCVAVWNLFHNFKLKYGCSHLSLAAATDDLVSLDHDEESRGQTLTFPSGTAKRGSDLSLDLNDPNIGRQRDADYFRRRRHLFFD